MKTEIIKLHVTDHLDKAFKILPSNADIDKGRCGIGGTTLEIEAPRPSIVIVCSLGGIVGKAKDNPQIFPVIGKVTKEDVADQLNKNIEDQKIFVTPDSFWKIIKGAELSIGTGILFSDFFVLYDEVHTAVSEKWRPNVLAPFEWIWKFRNKSFITATPCEINDPEYLKLDKYKIEFHEKYIGKINVVNCKPRSIHACVDAHIASADKFPGSLFFMYNSVTEIAEVIKRNNLNPDECNIYCADKEDNFEKLPSHLFSYKKEPETGDYAKFNFFTTRYFESFDLYADNATMILVTDINRTNTKVGVATKGVQAMGRCRNKPYRLIHITNHRNNKIMKTRDEFKREYQIHKMLINLHNQYATHSMENNVIPLKESSETIAPFCEIDDISKLAKFSQVKLDQVINELIVNEEFNDISFIEDAWKRAKYDVQVDEHKENTKLVGKRISKADQFKADVDKIHDLTTNPNSYVVGEAARLLQQMQKDSPSAYEAYSILKMHKIQELDYVIKDIKQALIDANNEYAESQLLPMLADEFTLFGNNEKEYTNEHVLNRLEFLYKKVKLKDKNGKPKKPVLSDFKTYNWFETKGCKIQTNRGKVNGTRFMNCMFRLRDAS